MKILKSIKWRLQLWHGLVLFCVLAGFGFTAYQLERSQQLHRVDEELNRRFPPLASALRGPPRNRPPPDDYPEDRPPPPPRFGRFELPPRDQELFSAADSNNFYYIIAGGRGEELARSSNAPPKALFVTMTNPNRDAVNSIPRLMPPPTSWTIGLIRTSDHFLPSGERIIVGCSIAPEIRELRRTAWRLTGAGAVILFFGLAGGWWISERAMRPIQNIGGAAAKISAGDLSQRIDVAETESELGQLAAVLNSTFTRLEAAFVRQRQFTSDAAHELRTPVSVMLTQTQAALQRERPAAEYREALEACQRSAQRMRGLIASLLELTRLDAGVQSKRGSAFDLAGAVAESAELVQPLAEERGIKIQTTLVSLRIPGDAERIGRAVTNLLTNAIQYNREKGEVRIGLEAQNGFAVLTVSDTGMGIAAEHLPRVFDRFYRADAARSGDAPHAGLGLAIAKAIIESHGGAITVESVLGTGSTFTLRLPAAENNCTSQCSATR